MLVRENIINLDINRDNYLRVSNLFINHLINHRPWQGDFNTVAFDAKEIKSKLRLLEKPCYIVRHFLHW